MKTKVCITGLGIVNPSGIDLKEFWENISNGANSVGKISRFDCSGFPSQVAGELKNFKATDFVPRRFAIKMDTFSHYAWAASSLAINNAKLNLEEINPYRIGVWLGNNSGGWDICEQGLFEMYRDGAAYVNPWQATAWFLSSAQGYVSIGNGLKGMSKSFCSDRTSGADAIAFASQAINLNRCDVILAGGSEAPLSSFGFTCYYETGGLAKSKDKLDVYKPFDKSKQGLVLGEGAAVLVLENEENAKSRGAHIYGKIIGAVMSNDADGENWKHLVFAIKKALQEGNVKPEQVDLIMPEGAATYESDHAEAMAIHEVFGENTTIPITCPKAGYGHLYGASAASDVICGLLASIHHEIPPTPNVQSPDFGLNVIRKKIKKEIHYILFISRAREGGNTVLLISTS